ncbi:MAG: hypothetical protein ACXWPI_08980 [Ktedonobacterales bacterium]
MLHFSDSSVLVLFLLLMLACIGYSTMRDNNTGRTSQQRRRRTLIYWGTFLTLAAAFEGCYTLFPEQTLNVIAVVLAVVLAVFIIGLLLALPQLRNRI